MILNQRPRYLETALEIGGGSPMTESDLLMMSSYYRQLFTITIVAH